MLFNSFTFFIFFGAFLLIYKLLPPSYRKYGLLAASYLFYAFWRIEYIALLFFSTFTDYVCAQQIQKYLAKKSVARIYLIISLCTNLGVLVFFKYADFLGVNIASLAQIFGVQASWTTLHLVLPLGISFYTFQTISYTLDVYYQRINAETDFGKVALYVSFFPQLVAGPIERAADLLPQFDKLQLKFSPEAIFWITLGFFKKMVVADNLAPFVDKIFNSLHQATPSGYIAGMYAFAIQIYADFSGYSDIAIGIALLLGVRLHQNFRQPYFAASFQEFWRRWHISLSFWLRDYLYFALGGSKNKKYPKLFTYRNLLITMALGGFWHGANWTFIVWGTLHGLLLIVERPFLHIRIKNSLFKILKQLWVFHWVVLAFVFFRAQDVHQAIGMIQHIGWGIWHIGQTFSLTTLPKVGIFFAFVLLLLDLAQQKQWLTATLPQVAGFRYWVRFFTLLVLFWAIMFFGMFRGAQFIYFQF